MSGRQHELTKHVNGEYLQWVWLLSNLCNLSVPLIHIIQYWVPQINLLCPLSILKKGIWDIWQETFQMGAYIRHIKTPRVIVYFRSFHITVVLCVIPLIGWLRDTKWVKGMCKSMSRSLRTLFYVNTHTVHHIMYHWPITLTCITDLGHAVEILTILPNYIIFQSNNCMCMLRLPCLQVTYGNIMTSPTVRALS